MLIAYWFLLFLYIALTLLYAGTKTQSTEISPWPILSILKEKKSLAVCNNSLDCPHDYICIKNQCIPKLLPQGICDPETGQWITFIRFGVTFAICACLQPHLINQKHFGGNCDVNVGCGIHGTYIREKNSCKCDPGYKAVGLTCQKLPAIDYLNSYPCGPDEIQVSKIKSFDGFHKEYVKRLSPLKCVKRPCSFDALNERPLKHAKFEPGWGCVCDPRYGLFGTVFEGKDKSYLSSPGFDGCASIFTEELKDPIDVKLITYFYLGNREPVSLILYENLNDRDLIKPLKGFQQVTLSQKLWQYDYAQHFFNENPTFRARTRQCNVIPLLDIERIYEHLYVNDFSPVNCDEIPSFWKNRLSPKIDAYNLLYKSPVCRVPQKDSNHEMFWNKVVVNPQHITFQDFKHLHRFNAFVLHYDSSKGMNRWSLDLDYPYKVNEYMSMDTNAPQYDVVRNPPPSIEKINLEGTN